MSEQEELSLGKTSEDGDAKVEISAAELAEIKSSALKLQSQLQTTQIANARLEEQVKQREPAAAEAPVLNREQLQAAVDEGRITQAQADTETQRQITEGLERKQEVSIDTKLAVAKQREVLQAEFSRYVEFQPEINQEGTPDNARVMKEIEALMKLGHTHDLRLEVTAIRNVFGPVERVEETTRKRREVTQETLGAGADAESGKGGKEWEKGLNAGQRAAFNAQIGPGKEYKDDNDPRLLRVALRARTRNKEAA